MMDPGWSLARVEEARASYFAEYVSIHIAGEMPDPCHFVDLERNLLTIEPPEFVARWHRAQGVICALVITPYEHQEVFHVGARRETVKLHHAEGMLEIPVRDLTQQLEEEDSTTGTALLTQGSPGEAVGYSDAFDFAEAFRDAMSHL